MDHRLTEIAEWAKGSAFNDGGLPRMWFHGTDETENPFNVFTRWEDEASFGFHFGSHKAANARINEIYRMVGPEENEGIIIPVFCRAQNPLRLPDLFSWGQRNVASELQAAGVVNEDVAEFIYKSASAEMIFAAIEEAGYDCVVYRNECEDKESAEDSLLIWRSELLKSPYASCFDFTDPRLLPQNPTAEDDLQSWRRLAQTIEDEKAALREFRAQMEPGSSFKAA